MVYVTLINRSSKPLQGTWDGRHYTIAPGKNSFPEIMAQKFKEQNPIMGTEDPYTMVREYLLGIEEHGDPITPAEQTASPTLADLKKQPHLEATPNQKVGLYAYEQKANLASMSGVVDTGFVKP